MGIEVTICYSPADAIVAEAIIARLERTSDVRVDRGALLAPDRIPDIWDRGTDSAGILLLLSPDSVPARADRASWASLLDHLEHHAASPPIAGVLIRECPVPGLVRRGTFFEWNPETLHAVQRWAIGLHAPPEQQTLSPAPVPWLTHSDPSLWTALVDDCGTVRLDDADAAQHFAYEAQAYFRQVAWIGCEETPPVFIRGEISEQLSAGASGRVLIVLEGVRGQPPVHRQGSASMLLVDEGNVTGDLPRDPDALRLWRGISVCRRESFSLEFAAEIAEIEDPGAASEELVAARLVVPLERSQRLFRRRIASVREPRYSGRHADVLQGVFERWRRNPGRCLSLLPEFDAAYRWSVEQNWTAAVPLASRVFDFLRDRQRYEEAIYVFDRLLHAARDRGDHEVAGKCEYELSWLRGRAPMDAARQPRQMALEFLTA